MNSWFCSSITSSIWLPVGGCFEGRLFKLILFFGLHDIFKRNYATQPPTNSRQRKPKTSSMVPLVATVVLRNTTELAQSPHHPVVLVQELICLPDEQVINIMILKMESHTGVFQP